MRANRSPERSLAVSRDLSSPHVFAFRWSFKHEFATRTASSHIVIREIGGECLGRAGSHTRIAADEAERLIPCGERFDKFVANGAGCFEDSERSDLPCAQTEE
jgi:hypothetical protein